MKLYFINPHAHHSYFTCLALSRSAPVRLLCPPLTLQLLDRQWRTDGLQLRAPSLISWPADLLAIVVFLLFKLNLCSETFYIRLFILASWLLLKLERGDQLVYHYQDYLLPILRRPCARRRFICELIIEPIPGEQNYAGSLQAAQQAIKVFLPTRMMQAALYSAGIPTFLAPYGGDKQIYRRSSLSKATLLPKAITKKSEVSIYIPHLRIAARANSLRKGLDFLLLALVDLDQRLSAIQTESVLMAIEIHICGAISEPILLQQFNDLAIKLRLSGRIALSYRQFPPDAYLELLHNSDLFVMPSRKEGSSLAALEALYIGIPCLLSKACGVEVFISGKHGWNVDPLTADVLADQLFSILQSPECLDSWSARLVQDKSLFSWDGYLQVVGESVEP